MRFWKDIFPGALEIAHHHFARRRPHQRGRDARARLLDEWKRDGAQPADRRIIGLTNIALVTTLACIFVYRHTARRRKLQAALTALFALVLTLAALSASPMFISF
jgi:hypothetical protein